MLRELHIRDLGIIADASVRLGDGLNVLTGETGVGKTLLVGSLALLTGERAQSRLVRAGAREAVVQGVLDLSPGLAAWLAEIGLEAEEELVVVRRLGEDGRSRAWVGGQLVPVSTLADMGERTVEIHGQGAGFALARQATQLAAVDALARNDEILGDFLAALERTRQADDRLHALRAEGATRERDVEYLTHLIDEIDRAALDADEDELLNSRLARLEHAEKLGAIATTVMELVGSEGAAGGLAEAHKLLLEAASIDGQAAQIVTCLGDVAAEAAEIAREIRSWAATLDGDPAQLEALRERKALVGNLKRKYGETVAAVLSSADEARARLSSIASCDERIAGTEAEVAAVREQTVALAHRLTQRRRRAAKQLTKLVCSELPALALGAAAFEVVCEPTEMTGSGCDRVDFMFSSSRTKPHEPIGKIASGGELSRAMIAVTLALAAAHEIGVLVFDEADQGVGGEAALELGRRLAQLGRSHQVLVVSHLPQIAAFADHHVLVERTGDEVGVRVLDADGRLGEISRMLAGLGTSDTARAHAGELLDLARDETQRAAAASSGR